MLIRRGIEPGYGLWAQPGGFLEIARRYETAAIRETLEETGLEVEPEAILGRTPASRPRSWSWLSCPDTGGLPITTRESLETGFRCRMRSHGSRSLSRPGLRPSRLGRERPADLPLPDPASFPPRFSGAEAERRLTAGSRHLRSS